jgi:hypothetical protein
MVAQCLYTMIGCTQNSCGAIVHGVSREADAWMKGVKGSADYRDDGVHGVQIAQLHYDEKQTHPF